VNHVIHDVVLFGLSVFVYRWVWLWLWPRIIAYQVTEKKIDDDGRTYTRTGYRGEWREEMKP
jgi:hypothetical protein